MCSSAIQGVARMLALATFEIALEVPLGGEWSASSSPGMSDLWRVWQVSLQDLLFLVGVVQAKL